MLTSVGRVAARRVVASANVSRSSLNSNAVLLNRPAFVLRPVSIRSFSVSRWSALATKEGTETTTPAKKTKKTTTTTKKTAKGTKATKAPAKKKKKKAAPKKKKVVKAKKPKKEKTPEEKKSEEVKVLKKQALLKEEPTPLPTNGWALFVQQRFNDHYKQSDTLTESIKHLKVEYENVPSMERERLESQGQANRQTNINKRQAWIQSLPVEDVYLANLARRKLKVLQGSKRASSKLDDERLPKRPLNAYSRYLRARFAAVGPNSSGPDSFKGAQETFKHVSQEWRNLRDAEKQQYERQYQQEMEAHREQMEKVRAKAQQKKKENAEALVVRQREYQAAYRARKEAKSESGSN